jgi:hypothetical protein
VWSLDTRATGISLAALSYQVFNFTLNTFAPAAFIAITWRLFIIFNVLYILVLAWF